MLNIASANILFVQIIL